MISIRKAEWKDIDAVEQIYNDIHDAEENGAWKIRDRLLVQELLIRYRWMYMHLVNGKKKIPGR